MLTHRSQQCCAFWQPGWSRLPQLVGSTAEMAVLKSSNVSGSQVYKPRDSSKKASFLCFTPHWAQPFHLLEKKIILVLQLMTLDKRGQVCDLLKLSQGRHWNQIFSVLALFYRSSVPKVCWRLTTELLPYRIDGDSSLHPGNSWASECHPQHFQERKSWACAGFSESRGLSKALDHNTQISMRAQSEADANSAVWKKSCGLSSIFFPS